jgi:hypothetical protein
VKLGMFIHPDNLAFLEMMSDSLGMDMEELLSQAVDIGCHYMKNEIAAITAKELKCYGRAN